MHKGLADLLLVVPHYISPHGKIFSYISEFEQRYRRKKRRKNYGFLTQKRLALPVQKFKHWLDT